MILAIRDRMDQRDEGFTLIELLVVVIIIGILAAIAIPTFLRQRERGWEADAQSNLRNAAIAQQSYFTGNNTYTNSVTDLENEGFTQSTGVEFNGTMIGTAERYCMAAQHETGGDAFILDTAGADAGQIQRVTRGTTCS